MDKTMLVKELDAALAILSTISVAGDAVEAMAAAKLKIRKVKAEIVNEEKDGANG